MEIGTVETITDAEKIRNTRSKVSRSSSTSGSGNGGGGGDGPDGGGPERPELPVDSPETEVLDKSKYIAWFLIMAVGMTFAGLLGAYLMLSTNKAAEWQPFNLPYQIWVSTAVILLSSITYSMAKRGVDNNVFKSARDWLGATTVLGGVFVASQLVLWLELVDRGYYVSGNPYAGFFYILTAAHLVHVAGGMIALGAMFLKAWYPAATDADIQRRRDLARSVGWYWHFMGILWVVLFIMLGFWR